MKKLFLFAAVICAAVFSSCSDEYDDTALRNELGDLANRVTALEELCGKMNTNITSLQTVVNALQQNDYVTAITPVKEGGKEVGYSITFAKAGTITIYHGQDGKDGNDGKDGKDATAPVISVKQDTDGAYYWTVNGEWLTVDGAKVPATGAAGKDGQNGQNGQDGQDGVTPQLKIEEGLWYVSYDEGETWTELGQATGDAGQDGAAGSNADCGLTVTYDDENVYFELADGTIITIPLGTEINVSEINQIKYVPVYEDGKATVISNGTDAVVTFDFEISPKSMAAEIAASWRTYATMEAVYTQTRASEFVEMPISDVTAKDGIITVSASAKTLGAEFLAGTQSASARLAIGDEESAIASDYVPMYVKVIPADNTALGVTTFGRVAPTAYQESIGTVTAFNGAAYFRVYNAGYEAGLQVGDIKTVQQAYFAIEKAKALGAQESDKLQPGNYKFAAKHWNEWVMVLAFDANDKPIAGYQDKTYVPSVVADDAMLQYHQPQFSISFADGKWQVKADHISAAVGYAKEFKWEVKNAAGKVVASGETSVDKAATTTAANAEPTLKSATWDFEMGTFAGNTDYEFSYEIAYAPQLNKFVNVTDDGTALTLRPLEKSGELFKFTSTSGNTSRSAKCDYKNYYADPNLTPVVLTSDDFIDAGANLDDKIKVHTESMLNPKATNVGLYEQVKIEWTPIPGAAFYTVANSANNDIAKVTGTSYVFEGDDYTHSYIFTVKAYNDGSALIETADTDPTHIWTLAGWTEPTFEWIPNADGTKGRICVHNLTNVANGFAYAYGGMTADGGKSTLKIYDAQGTLVSTLTNSTPISTLDAWAGYKRWALNAQDDRKDWVWTGTIDSGGKETEVSALTPGKYTIEWTIGYVISENSTWATNNGSFIPQASKDGATHIYYPNGKNDVWKGADNVIKTHTMTGSSELVIKGDLRLSVAPQNLKDDGTYQYYNITLNGKANGTGHMASGGIYQGLKVCKWNEVKTAASYDVYYRVNGSTNWIKKANVTTNSYDGFGAETLTEASKYDFKVVALDANGNEMCYDEQTIDIYTLRDIDVDFEAVQDDDMTWKINAYNLSGPTYAFASVSFKVKDGTTVVAEGSKNLGKEMADEVAFNIWLGNRACACYVNNNNSDWDNAKFWAADALSGKKTYTVEYTLNAKALLPTEWCTTHNGWGFSCALWKNETWSSVTKTTTLTVKAQNVAPTVDLAGTWTADTSYASTTNAMKNAGHVGGFTFVKVASENGKSPKGGQKYYAQYKRFADQDVYFDVDTKEMADKPGCYAIINLIDREAATDKVTNNNSYYDSVNDIIYFDFVTEASGSPGVDADLGSYTVAGYLWTAKMTR